MWLEWTGPQGAANRIRAERQLRENTDDMRREKDGGCVISRNGSHERSSLSVFQTIGLLDCLTVLLSDCHNIILSDCKTVSLFDCQTVRLSDF